MDNARSEKMVGQDHNPDIESKPDSNSECAAAPASEHVPDSDGQAIDKVHAAINNANVEDDISVLTPALIKAGDTPVVVGSAETLPESADSAERGPVEPKIQLPAVVQGGPIAPYVAPVPYDPLDIFFLEVRRNLPPRYEFNEETSKIITRSASLRPIPLCGPLWVCRLFRTPDGLDWSREVQFLDLDGVVRHHVIAASELIANGRGVVARLVSLGLDVPGDPALLAALMRAAEVTGRAEILHKPGWTSGPDPTFSLPTGEVIAKHATGRVSNYQYQGPLWDKATLGGTLAGWQTGVAACAVGNPAIIFAISFAFLGPLLPIIGIKTVGFHIYGRTSAGKSIVAAMAQSVWHSAVLQGWDVTLPALEQICRTSHQTFCLLDELRSDTKLNLGEAIYNIFNGSNRAISEGGKKNRAAENWNVCLLSVGEQAAEDILTLKGTLRSGHLVRFIDINLATQGETIFPTLYGFSDSYAFVKHIEEQLAQQAGAAGQAWIQALVSERTLRRDKIKIFHTDTCASLRRHLGLEGQPLQGEVARVIERFAAVATAGTVATHLGILPWGREDAYRAVLKFAKRWLSDRGGNVSNETGTVVLRARDFLLRFGDSRFQWIEDARAGRVVNDLAGWITEDHFHMTPAAFKQECAQGMGADRAARCLFDAGYLTPGGELGSLQNKMLSGVKDHGLDDAKERPRCYSIKRTILGA